MAALSLKARALRWLAQREHSRAELRRKLLHQVRAEAAAAAAADDGAAGRDLAAVGGIAPAAAAADAAQRVDALLDWLERERHLSPARFVESRVHLRAGRLGTRRIEAELAEHDLALDAAQREALAASEFERARAVFARRFGEGTAADGNTAPDAAETARRMRFLLGRGFAPEVARRVVRGAANGPDDALEDGGA